MAYHAPRTVTRPSCETRRKARALACALVTVAALAVAPVLARAQEHAQPAPAGQPASAPGQGTHATPSESPRTGEAGPAGVEHAEGAGEHHESIWGPISRLVNFLILVGALVYFFRAPFQQYLADRHRQVRADLDAAAEMKRAASAQMTEVEHRLRALPEELDELKRRGTEEIAAEERRITAAAEAERERLIEQTRREIDLQLRIAQRELVEHAANLAVNLATEQVKSSITPEDQARLVDRYLQQVKG